MFITFPALIDGMLKTATEEELEHFFQVASEGDLKKMAELRDQFKGCRYLPYNVNLWLTSITAVVAVSALYNWKSGTDPIHPYLARDGREFPVTHVYVTGNPKPFDVIGTERDVMVTLSHVYGQLAKARQGNGIVAAGAIPGFDPRKGNLIHG